MKKSKKRDVPTTRATRTSAKQRISVCLIVKNEEKYLDRCLRSVKPVADEIILVDTGSTDRTVEIARKYTDKIYHHLWNDSFSEARNHYLKYATGDWIFQIDADEELFSEDVPEVRHAIRNDSIDAIAVRIVSTARGGRNKAVHNVERIFRNNGVIHYEGRVHNRVVGIASLKISPVRFLHHGYDLPTDDEERKFARTVSLLKKDLDEMPDNPATHHYLSCSYLSRKMDPEAIEHGLKAIRLADLRNSPDSMFLWTRYNLSLAYYRSGRPDNAEKAAVDALKRYPDHIDSHFMMIVICFDQKRWSELLDHAACYLRLLRVLNSNPSHFGTLMTCSLNEEWNMHILTGIAYFELEQETASQESFEKAVQSAPEPFIALRAIGIYFHSKSLTDTSLLYLKRAHQAHPNDEAVNRLLTECMEEKKHRKNPTISCCMIVKDEEEFLDQCLKSITNYVDEIIIVDTGSTDNTVDIARRYTERVYFHPWEGSFSKARNQVLQYATCDWIFQIDGDEELVEGSGEKLKQAVRNAGEADAIYVNIISTYGGGRKTARHNFERLFRNNGVIHYESIVHNRVAGQTCTKSSKIELMHYGYDVDEKKALAKFMRTTGLLKEQIANNPDNPEPYHYLGASYLSRGMYKECIEVSSHAIALAERQNIEDVIYLWTHNNAARSYFALGDLDNARHYSLRCLSKHSDHLDSLYMMTLLSAEEKKWSDVLQYGVRFLELRDYYENNYERMGRIIYATLKEGASANLLVGHAFHALGDNTTSDHYYRIAESMSEDAWRTWWNIGTFHMDRSGDLALSRRYLERALEKAPEEPSVWYMMAKWSSKAADEREEQRCLLRLFELGSREPVVLNRLVVLSLASDDLTAAAGALEALLILEPRNFPVLCKLGSLYRRLNALDRAMEAYGKAIEINSRESAPWLNLGEIALQLGRYDDARLFFERVRSLGAETIAVLLYLCETELRQDRIVEFVRWCDLLLKELRLNRDRTIHTLADLTKIVNEIKMSLLHDSVLSAQASILLSLLPPAGTN